LHFCTGKASKLSTCPGRNVLTRPSESVSVTSENGLPDANTHLYVWVLSLLALLAFACVTSENGLPDANTHLYVYTYMHIKVCMYVCMYVRMYVCTHGCICMHACMPACMYAANTHLPSLAA
jgi:hypothetical protein